MHEWSMMRNLIDQIRDIADQAGGGRVVGVKVRLGALSAMSAAHFREHFMVAADHMIGSDVALDVETSEDLQGSNATDVVLAGVEIETN